MRAGRKLDVEVAEKVMGQEVDWRWCERDYETGGWFDVEDIYTDDDDDSMPSLENLEESIKAGDTIKFPCARNYRDDGSFYHHEELSKYSIDIVAAERVIKRLNELEYSVDIEVCWSAKGEVEARALHLGDAVADGQGPTAPLAICLLALDLLEWVGLTTF